jgi:hypothetical protein
MTTQPLVGYGGYTPEQYQMIVRRAHAERAEVLRQFFRSLLAWRGKVAQPRASDPQPAAAGCH